MSQSEQIKVSAKPEPEQSRANAEGNIVPAKRATATAPTRNMVGTGHAEAWFSEHLRILTV